MRNVAVIFLVLTIIIAVTSATKTNGVRSNDEVMSMYLSWMAKHGKNYNGIGEEEKRFNIFKDNLGFIDEHNSNENKTFTVGLNKFADLTNEEYKAMYLGTKSDAHRRVMKAKRSVSSQRYAVRQGETLPESVDWRDLGAVSSVKDQGSCGIDSDKDYPYRGYDNQCDPSRVNSKVVSIDGYEDVPAYDENALKKAVSYQPVSVAIEAGGPTFQFYESGVFTGRCGAALDHGVVAVGYGTENGVDYWLVRNSWGSDWGESGYIKMERNVATYTGKCGIAMIASYPTKNGQADAILYKANTEGMISSS
ncbi:hypothetical protein ACFE04_002529 [Oxalis oulophora]